MKEFILWVVLLLAALSLSLLFVVGCAGPRDESLFVFEVGEEATIKATNKIGLVINRRRWSSPDEYYIRYADDEGELHNIWLKEYELLQE